MSSEEAPRRICIDKLYVYVFRQVKVFVLITIRKTYSKRLCFVLKIENRSSNGKRIFFCRFFFGFRRYAYQDMISFYDRFAFFFRCSLTFLTILKLIRMPVFHKSAINCFELLQTCIICYTKQFSVINNLFQ